MGNIQRPTGHQSVEIRMKNPQNASVSCVILKTQKGTIANKGLRHRCVHMCVVCDVCSNNRQKEKESFEKKEENDIWQSFNHSIQI